MAVTVGTAVATGTYSGTTQTLPSRPSGAAGLAFVVGNPGSALTVPTPPSGWTQIYTSTATYPSLLVFAANDLTTAGLSFVSSNASNQRTLAAVGINGAASNWQSTLALSAQTSGSGATVTVATPSTTVAGSLVVGVVGDWGASASNVTTTSPGTEMWDQNSDFNWGHQSGTWLSASGGTQTLTWTLSQSSGIGWASVAVVLPTSGVAGTNEIKALYGGTWHQTSLQALRGGVWS